MPEAQGAAPAAWAAAVVWCAPQWESPPAVMAVTRAVAEWRFSEPWLTAAPTAPQQRASLGAAVLTVVQQPVMLRPVAVPAQAERERVQTGRQFLLLVRDALVLHHQHPRSTGVRAEDHVELRHTGKRIARRRA